MDCKATSTRKRRRSAAGATLVEALIAIGVTGLIMLALASISMVSGRSFVAFANYVDLDSDNRIAMDTLTRDLRECNQVSGFSTNQLVIEGMDGFSITYQFNSGPRTRTRTRNGVVKTLLTECDTLTFNIAQRNPVNGSYDVYPTATPGTAKVVNVSWNCSRTILGHKANTENVQTARIVIRRQG
jgi:Tfp pilus assembly protein PilW